MHLLRKVVKATKCRIEKAIAPYDLSDGLAIGLLEECTDEWSPDVRLECQRGEVSVSRLRTASTLPFLDDWLAPDGMGK